MIVTTNIMRALIFLALITFSSCRSTSTAERSVTRLNDVIDLATGAVNPVDAIRYWNEAILLQPNSAWLHFQRGLSHIEAGNIKQAKTEQDEIKAIDPTSVYELLLVAEIHRATGAYSEAVHAYNGCIYYLNDEQAIRGRALAHLGLCNAKEVIADASRLIVIAPDNSEYYALRAKGYMLANDRFGALSDISTAYLIPKNPYFLMVRGLLHIASAQQEDANADFFAAFKGGEDFSLLLLTATASEQDKKRLQERCIDYAQHFKWPVNLIFDLYTGQKNLSEIDAESTQYDMSNCQKGVFYGSLCWWAILKESNETEADKYFQISSRYDTENSSLVRLAASVALSIGRKRKLLDPVLHNTLYE
jgi:tetratricopeptide (TPR) repeat protein